MNLSEQVIFECQVRFLLMMITLSAVHHVETKVAMIMSMDTTSKEPRITKRKIHNVLDDVVNCKTVEEKKCEQVTDGEHKDNVANISMHINVMCQDFGPRNSVTPGLLKDARWSRSVSTRPPRRRPAERSPGSCALPGGARRSRHGTLDSSKYYSTK